jgi:small subunit ribosomal protein S1
MAVDRTTPAMRPIAGGSAPETQDEIEDLYQQSLQDLQEGEVVKGTIIGLTSSEVLVDVGYKSEGTIPIDEFHRSGITPEIGQEIEVYLEAKEDSEGLIVLSKEKADKIKV